MLRVDLSSFDEGLDEGVEARTLSPSADDLGLDPEVFSTIVLDLRLDVAERRVLASFEVRAVATLECDRTLVSYHTPVPGDHAVLFVPLDPIPPAPEDDALPPSVDPA